MGLIFGCIMYLLDRFLRPLYKMLLLEENDSLGLRSFIFAGALGTGLHVLLDAPLYEDIKPLYPIAANPFYNPSTIHPSRQKSTAYAFGWEHSE